MYVIGFLPMNQLWLYYHTYWLCAKVLLSYCTLFQEFDKSVAAEHSFFELRQPDWSISDARDLFFQRKMRFELDLCVLGNCTKSSTEEEQKTAMDATIAALGEFDFEVWVS